MSKKARMQGNQASRQQQQEAAARRHTRRAAAGPARGTPLVTPSSPGPGSARTGDEQRAEARYYLDVSAVRIQEWLARTPDLKFRRGASVLLSEVTGRAAWPDEALPEGMRWNEEAGDLDGVVALIVKEPVAEPGIEDRLTSAARAVARRMRGAMPYCQIQAVAGKGDSYAAAYEHMERARRDGDFLIDSPPAPPEVILAKLCDQCRSAAAVRRGITIIAGERQQDLCRDCHERFEAAGGTKGDKPRRSPRPERRMKEALREAGMKVEGFPDNFKKMAEAGEQDGDDAATQLALIYADGNKVGAFLHEAAGHARRHGKPAKAEIVPALDNATLAALADAITDRFPGWSRPAVLAHLAGGDDLLVSVPAIDAWMFVRALLTAFGMRIDEAASGWPGSVRRHLPSLSAGLVFHHLTAPFPDVARLAGEQLDKAKRAGQGCKPTVAFLDLTADGGHEPPGREPLTLADVDERAKLLVKIEKIPRSRRETLVALHRLASEDDSDGEPPQRAETPVEAFIRRVTDLDNEPLWEAIAGTGSGPSAVRGELTEHPGKRDDLRRILDMARYWHTAARTEPGQLYPARAQRTEEGVA